MDKFVLLGFFHLIFISVVLKTLNFLLPSFLSDIYKNVANLLLFLYIAWLTFLQARRICFNKRVLPKNKAVLITGCDTGFGHELAKRLDSLGFTVYASCLFPSGDGATALKETCSSNLQILELDVTKDESVKNAADFVEKNLGKCDLWAIVNNAGIAKGLTVELSTVSDFRDTLEVNTLGPIKVTKAFLPFLKQSKGRVVNVASLAGRLALEGSGPYSTSKFALVGFTECLKQEMNHCGVNVISIEPEVFHTRIASWTNVSKNLEESFQNADDGLKKKYKDKYMNISWKKMKFFSKIASRDIHAVIDTLESAVSLEYPQSVYRPCRNFVVNILVEISLHIPRNVSYFVMQTFWELLARCF